MELKVFESPKEEWDEFASRYTDLIFYRSVWSQVLREGLRGQPLYFYLKEGNDIVSGLPGVLLNFKFFKILYASIPYGGFIGERSYFSTFTELLSAEFKRMGIDQVRITDSPFLLPYHPDSFKSISLKCSLLDLSGLSKEKIWVGYKKYIRRDIRKAQKSGVSVRQGTSKEDIKIFYKLYLASMERNRAVAKYPFSWFEAIYNVAVMRYLGTILLAELNQEAIAGIITINSKSSTHYLHNGSRYEFLRFCPNELLIHYCLEMAIEHGNIYFDFMGSDPNDLPLIHFKEKWGSRSLDIYTYLKDYHPVRCKLWELGKGCANSRIGRVFLKIFRD